LAQDWLRAIGVVSMVLYHSLIWVAGKDPGGALQVFKEAFWYRHINWVGMPALWLPAIAGTSLALRPASRSPLYWGASFLILATLGNGILWSEFSLWRWDILHFIAACFIVYGISQKWDSRRTIPILGACCALVYFAGIRLPPSPWPFIPWFGLFALGVWVGAYRLRLPGQLLRPREFLFWLSLTLAALLLPSSTSWLSRMEPFHSHLFSPPPSIFIALSAGYVLAQSTLDQVAYLAKTRPTTPLIVRKFSNAAFPIFLVHLVIGVFSAEAACEVMGAENAFFFLPLYMLLTSWAIAEWAWEKRGLTLIVRGRRVKNS
jgi:hypothetical protein